MKLGDVLKKEREAFGLTVEQMVAELDIPAEQYAELENGTSDAENWGPTLAQIAIELETPTSRLLADSGRAEDTRPGQAGELIAKHRGRREKSEEDLASAIGVDADTLQQIESGESPIETIGPILLRFAEVIEQPVFNLFYPCGLPFQELDDYP
ncbi:MAG: helix-turn-helix transcriptional regulator [Acidobacteriota bacterium]